LGSAMHEPIWQSCPCGHLVPAQSSTQVFIEQCEPAMQV
jgi:hypothetical protein